MATMGVEHLTKDMMVLLFKVAIVALLFTEAKFIYDSLIGVMGEMIGWVGGGFVGLQHKVGCDTSTIQFLGAPGTTASNATERAAAWAQQYKVWMGFDCIFQTMLGVGHDASWIYENAANGGTATPSLAKILTIALFSGLTLALFGMGIFVVMVGLTACLAVIITLGRGLYHVLLSYLTLSFLMVLAPLIAPMLMFNSHDTKSYTRQFFDKWLGLIISTLFQPIFFIGFLSFAVTTMDVFINASDSDSPVNPAVAECNNGNPNSLCSFKQIANDISFQQNLDFLSFKSISTFAQKALSGFVTNDYNAITNFKTDMAQFPPDIIAAQKDMVGWVVGNAEVVGSLALQEAQEVTISFWGLTPTAAYLAKYPGSTIDDLLHRLIITLMTFIFVSLVMLSLLNTVPDMARTITISVGIGLISQMRAPFESTIAAAVKGLGEGMKNAMAGSKGLERITNIPRAVGRGLGGGASEGAKKFFDIK